MGFWVYLVRCSDGAYYVGSHRGEDVAVRVEEHNAGLDTKAYTFTRRPVELVWADEFQLALDMIAFERRLKGWSRAKKEALTRGDWSEVSRLAKSPRPSTSSG